MSAWLAACAMVIGSTFMLLAAVGVWRFPDVLTRMQAAAKAGTLGAGCLLGAVAIHFAQIAVTAHVLLIVLLFLLTAPVAAHRIARAAHRIGVPLWEGTHRDELRELRAIEPGSPVEEDVGARRPAEPRLPPPPPPPGTARASPPEPPLDEPG